MENVGSKSVVWGVFGGEMISVAFELRWIILLSIILILADLWWGHSESMKRYAEAKRLGDRLLMEKYRWRKSRAIRRSVAKFIDYSTYWLIGAFFGMAIAEPLGFLPHLQLAALILFLGCLAEVASIIGHVCYVKYNIEVKISDITKAVWRFAISLFKIKSKEIGEALEETINEEENKKEE